MPKISRGAHGFLSNAHLRDDEYWREILGQDLDLEGPFQWIESGFIHWCVGLSIIMNACALSIRHVSEKVFWAEQAVLAFSIFELAIVMARRQAGIHFKTRQDAYFISVDCLVVAICTTKQWGIPLGLAMGFDTGIQNSSVANTLIGMVWLMRFFRLIRIVPSLNELARGVMDAIQGLFWVLLFMLLLIYAVAILCTRLLGHFDASGMEPQQREEVEEVQKMFAKVPTSMFYLFETMSSWTLVPLIPLFGIAPVTRLFFVFFYIYAGWTLLAVMTGVVSFNMIALRAQITREDAARDSEKRNKAKEVLMEIFEFSDADRSGELNYEEFHLMLSNKDIIKSIEANTNIKLQDLEDLWQWLDDDNSDTVSWDEFLRGFQWLNEPFRPKTLLRLQEKITREVKILKQCFYDLITKDFDSIVQHVSPPMRKMHAVTEQVQLLEVACQSLRANIIKVTEDAEKNRQLQSRQSPYLVEDSYTLDDFEKRIGAQIDDVLVRLEKFVPAQNKHRESFQNPAAKARANAPDLYNNVAFSTYKDPLLHEGGEELLETLSEGSGSVNSEGVSRFNKMRDTFGSALA